MVIFRILDSWPIDSPKCSKMMESDFTFQLKKTREFDPFFYYNKKFIISDEKIDFRIQK